MTEEVRAEPQPRDRRGRVRFLLLSNAFLAAFAFASTQVPTMNALMLGAASLVLALPVMLALGHRMTVRRLILLQRFQPGQHLHWWGSRRFIGLLVAATVSVGVTMLVLLQSVYFGRLEWALVLLLPWLYLVLSNWLDVAGSKQFVRPVYARSWTQWTTNAVLLAALSAIWTALSYATAETPATPFVARVSELQAAWPTASSGIVKWALDGGAWGQVAVDRLRQWLGEAPLRLLLALVVAPVSVFGLLTLAMSGLSQRGVEIRRVLTQTLTDDDSPPPVGEGRAAFVAAIATLGVFALFSVLADVDSQLKNQDSPFAVRTIPCERIGGKAYRVNTARSIAALLTRFQRQMDSNQAQVCQSLSDIDKHVAKRVDVYLDWYFSLGAEWLRLATMLTGDINQFLQFKFNDVVFTDPKVGSAIGGLPAVIERQWVEFADSRMALLELLEKNRLVASEAQCQEVKEIDGNLGMASLDAFKARIVGGVGAGAMAGGLAAKITAKAMGKASMKAAAKVLAKAAAKKGAAAAAGAAAGAALGTVVPGLGTAAGALAGGAVGLTLGVGIDLAALYVEEKLTRDLMRADLLAAASESLGPLRQSFDCK